MPNYYPPSSGGGGGSGGTPDDNSVTSAKIVDGTIVDADISASAAISASKLAAIPESGITSLVADLALKAPLANPSLTGTPTVPTAAQGTNTTQAASTAMVHSEVVLLAPKASPTYTGTVDMSGATVTLPSGLVLPASVDIGTALSAVGDGTPAINGTAARGTGTHAARNDHVHPTDTSRAPTASPTFTGTTTAPEFTASGLTGATAASRYVGATASGSPASGTFAVGDFVIDQAGTVWICTIAGSPGTWTGPTTATGERGFVLGKAGAISATETDASDMFFIVPFNCTLLRMKAVVKSAVTGAMTVQLRAATTPSNSITWGNVSGFVCTYTGSGYFVATIDPANVNASEGDLLGFSCATGSGADLLVEVVVILR